MRSPGSLRRQVLFVISVCLAATGASAQTIEKIAITGDLAPGTGGGTFGSVMHLSGMDVEGDVGLVAGITDGTLPGTSSAVTFTSHTDGTLVATAVPGQAGPGGSTFTSVAAHLPNVLGERAIWGSIWVSTGTGDEGLWVEGLWRESSSGVFTEVAVVADVAPGTGGLGTYIWVSPGLLRDNGELIFTAEVFYPPNSNTLTIFLEAPDGDPTPLSSLGDTAPDTAGGTFGWLTGIAMNEAGDIAFTTPISGSTVTHGIFVIDSSGTIESRVVTGQTAPGTGGGTFSSLPGSPALNESGDILFRGNVTGGSTAGGLFVVDANGAVTWRILDGQAAPPDVGGTLSNFSPYGSMNDAGLAVFSATITGGNADRGVFSLDSNGQLLAKALQGRPVPGGGGSLFHVFDGFLVNDRGDIAFSAWWVVSGMGYDGIFFIEQPHHVPALSPWGLGVLAGLIGLGATRRRRNEGKPCRMLEG